MAYGIEFVLLGMESQSYIYYGMPVRDRMYHSLVYLKECQIFVAYQKKVKV
ncbi:MAG: hypothetical protein IAC13_01605 [Firmicutes bacterium]|uniref:Uncharacterized protein n=1 Tax=Candidatus Scybalomonas excrementavium TaxID=2840943 RepID=A0A9D9HYP2_9FIRM|nr:hypothetical protein [Candidatus Scybalomonas excrementavium]